MLRKPKRHSEKGYALLTAMAVGVVALSLTSAVLLRMSSSTAQITQRERIDEAQNISESVLNHVLDSIAEITANGTDVNAGIYKTAKALSIQMHDNDFLNLADNSGNATQGNLIFSQVTGASLPTGSSPHSYDTSDGRNFVDTGTSAAFWTSLENNPAHSTAFWSAFKKSSSNTALGMLSATVGGVTLTPTVLDNLHNNAYSVYHVKKGRLDADVEISVVPMATNVDAVDDVTLHNEGTFKNHNDVLRIRVMTYLPNIKQPTRTHKLEVIVNRPVRRKDSADLAFSHAVLGAGPINLQNFNVTSGPCAAGESGGSCIDHTTTGDVHSNTSLSIGSNGYVQGKATAVGNVNVNGTVLPATSYQHGSATDPRDTSAVTSRVANAPDSESGVDEIPLPKMNTDTSAVDLMPCVDLAPLDTDLVIYENCKLTGNLDVNNNKMVEYRGTVHITGDVDIRGSQRCTGSGPCKIVIDGTVNVAGNGDSTWNSTQEALYVIKGTGASAGSDCLDIGGNPDAAGAYGSLFYIDNPDCNTRVRGNSDFFGGILTAGSVNTNGNACQYGIQRDSDMSSLSIFVEPEPVPKNQLFPAVISWKDLK